VTVFIEHADPATESHPGVRGEGLAVDLLLKGRFAPEVDRLLSTQDDAGDDHLIQCILERRSETMTILVAYVPRPEGQAALDKGMEIARSRQERLVVVNASPGGKQEDPSKADVQDVERVEELLARSGLNAEFKQFVRGQSAVAEIEALVDSLQVSLLIIGLRKRTAVGKLILGSVAQDVLLSVSCPVLAVKAS
jgi:nucleotide-binding universal stress UspA family protein